MDNLKKAGIIGGAVVGGVIGGAVSIVGHVAKNKFLDELGGNIVDSTILTGQIAGEAASGATDIVTGKIKGKPRRIYEGKKDLKRAGGKVVNNVVTNCKTIVSNSSEILEGVKEKDTKKIIKGAKTLGKIAAIGAITVGAVKVSGDESKAGGDEKGL